MTDKTQPEALRLAEKISDIRCQTEGEARAIEAEVRKQDDALIQQMLEALETAGVYPPSSQAAITAGRARLGEKT